MECMHEGYLNREETGVMKKWNRKIPLRWVFVGIVMGLILSGTMVLTYFKIRGVSPSQSTSLAKPEIIETNGYIVNRTRATPEGPVFVVEVSVRNNGDAGWIKICVIIYGYERYEIREEKFHLETGFITQFFFDISQWGVPESPEIDHNVWTGIN